MKAYAVFPLIDLLKADGQRVDTCITIVTEIVCSSLRAGGDTFHVTVDWRDPDGEPWSVCTEGLAEPNIVSLSDATALEELVRLSVDPRSPKSAAEIRSMATCRVATFGYDGQAFLCLRHEDGPPTSPVETLVEIVEKPEYLTHYDYFDGFIVSPVKE